MPGKKETSVEVLEIDRGQIEYCIMGTTPTIQARMSEKAKQELLMPKGRKTQAQRAASLKHYPLQEFQASPYVLPDDTAPTYLACLSAAFKRMISSAALDIPGSTKAQIGRLLWVEGERVPLWGTPQIFMAVTRSADMNRTPDVRTRCIVTDWATRITVSFVKPVLNETAVTNLLGAAGLIRGLGDWRPEKGAGTYGQFELVSEDDKEFVRRMELNREYQRELMVDPLPYDDETEEMLEWFDEEVKRRGVDLEAVAS